MHLDTCGQKGYKIPQQIRHCKRVPSPAQLIGICMKI